MRILLLMLTALCALAPGLRAQPALYSSGPIGDADLLYFAGRPAEAYQLLARHLDQHPDDYEALWRAARARVMAGIEEEETERQNLWFDEAILLGDRAVALRPDGIDGLHWRGAALGRRALNASAGYAAELAERVWDDAHAILAIDPAHGGAHNLLGRLSFEIMNLSRIERFVGRVRYDTRALDESSWEVAEEHLRAAVELWPDTVSFQLDLAELYRERGREQEAKQTLEHVLELAPVHPPDVSLKHDAELLLEELGS